MPRTFLDDVFDQVMAVKRKPTPKPVDACPAAGPSTSRGVGTRRRSADTPVLAATFAKGGRGGGEPMAHAATPVPAGGV
ncbi:hypothetical protein HGRIS_001229 [Hohenbuehelia grisea]|uniref:Uncharacterized protein n=1 Tax=Hohenbuehelia grisea TaxID=104357 RepID=A0ABR3JNV2_9AGAR